MNPDWPADLQDRLREFARERNWEQYHTPRNLAALIASEAGELLAHFRWGKDATQENRQEVENELADVLLGILRFADVAGIDLNAAALHKLQLNATKYPTGSSSPEPLPATATVVVCGIDSGTFKTPSYVAWLRGGQFALSSFRPTAIDPLPQPPAGWSAPRVYALDLPQGLARRGEKRRTADAAAGTPTRVLPGTRAELNGWKLYKGLIEAGVESFWSIHSSGVAHVAGLRAPSSDQALVVETYPRYIIRRMWPDLKIPSKRKTPEEYTRQVWTRLEAAGFTSVHPPTQPDHVDAMLCAIAARACEESDGLPEGTVGAPPYIDLTDNLIREGYIVAP